MRQPRSHSDLKDDQGAGHRRARLAGRNRQPQDADAGEQDR
jgi:hypothetical protein